MTQVNFLPNAQNDFYYSHIQILVYKSLAFTRLDEYINFSILILQKIDPKFFYINAIL